MGCASGERSEVAVDSSASFAGLQTPTDAVPLLVLGKDSRALPAGWQPWVLHPTKAQTRYRVVRDAEVGAVVSAEADASASGLLRELNLEVSRAPVLEWQWRIDSLIEGLITPIDTRKTRRCESFWLSMVINNRYPCVIGSSSSGPDCWAGVRCRMPR